MIVYDMNLVVVFPQLFRIVYYLSSVGFKLVQEGKPTKARFMSTSGSDTFDTSRKPPSGKIQV